MKNTPPKVLSLTTSKSCLTYKPPAPGVEKLGKPQVFWGCNCRQRHRCICPLIDVGNERGYNTRRILEVLVSQPPEWCLLTLWIVRKCVLVRLTGPKKDNSSSGQTVLDFSSSLLRFLAHLLGIRRDNSRPHKLIPFLLSENYVPKMSTAISTIKIYLSSTKYH